MPPPSDIERPNNVSANYLPNAEQAPSFTEILNLLNTSTDNPSNLDVLKNLELGVLNVYQRQQLLEICKSKDDALKEDEERALKRGDQEVWQKILLRIQEKKQLARKKDETTSELSQEAHKDPAEQLATKAALSRYEQDGLTQTKEIKQLPRDNRSELATLTTAAEREERDAYPKTPTNLARENLTTKTAPSTTDAKAQEASRKATLRETPPGKLSTTSQTQTPSAAGGPKQKADKSPETPQSPKSPKPQPQQLRPEDSKTTAPERPSPATTNPDLQAFKLKNPETHPALLKKYKQLIEREIYRQHEQTPTPIKTAKTESKEPAKAPTNKLLGKELPKTPPLKNGFTYGGYSGELANIPLNQFCPKNLQQTMKALGIDRLMDFSARVQNPMSRHLLAASLGLPVTTLLLAAHRSELLDLPILKNKAQLPHLKDLLFLSKLGIQTLKDLSLLHELFTTDPLYLETLSAFITAYQKNHREAVGKQPLSKHDLKEWAAAATRRDSWLTLSHKDNWTDYLKNQTADPQLLAKIAAENILSYHLAERYQRHPEPAKNLWETMLQRLVQLLKPSDPTLSKLPKSALTHWQTIAPKPQVNRDVTTKVPELLNTLEEDLSKCDLKTLASLKTLNNLPAWLKNNDFKENLTLKEVQQLFSELENSLPKDSLNLAQNLLLFALDREDLKTLEQLKALLAKQSLDQEALKQLAQQKLKKDLIGDILKLLLLQRLSQQSPEQDQEHQKVSDVREEPELLRQLNLTPLALQQLTNPQNLPLLIIQICNQHLSPFKLDSALIQQLAAHGPRALPTSNELTSSTADEFTAYSEYVLTAEDNSLFSELYPWLRPANPRTDQLLCFHLAPLLPSQIGVNAATHGLTAANSGHSLYICMDPVTGNVIQLQNS